MGETGRTGHVVLLGDSVFDNAAYVSGGPDVVRQLRERLPAGWQATLAAVDGATTADVPRQVRGVPEDATHLVLSVGGNDALGRLDILEAPARSVADALGRLAEMADRFEDGYRAALEATLGRGLPTALCTVYDPRFPDPVLQRLCVTGLAHFNDRILRAAFGAGLPVLDLRSICGEDADFANPIEPSTRGGAKMADAIVGLVTTDPWSRGRSEVLAGRDPAGG